MRKTLILVILGVFTLAACTSPEQQQASMARVAANMPDNCKLYYAGEVDVAGHTYPSRIFYTICTKADTITSSSEYTAGTSKNHHSENSAVVTILR